MNRRTVPLMRVILIALAGFFFFAGIDWGLPSRTVDPLLFGPNRTPWTGAQIQKAAGVEDDAPERGSDVAAHPLAGRSRPLVVNGNDTDRARILRRYRLFSNQPDEMITFRALSRMKPGHGDFDPRFFQYGGAWVYPVGALLKASSLLGLVEIRGDVAFYYDHPEAFGRYYIVARSYSAAWGLVGVLLIFELTRAWTGNNYAGAFAGAMYTMMPVVVNAAHEAKPHLAGSVLVLATLWAATRHLSNCQRSWAIAAAVAAGVAASMVWTAGVAVAVLPVMIYLSSKRSWRFAAALVGIAAGVFLVLNPYLPIDLMLHRAVVSSNVGNSTAMYHATLSVGTILNAARLIGEAMNPIVAIAAVAAVVYLAVNRQLPAATSSGAQWLPYMALVPAVLVAGQFVLLATGKPAEYARFSLTLDLLLVIALAAACTRMRRPMWRRLTSTSLLIVIGGSGSTYVRHFRNDRPPVSTRLQAGRQIADTRGVVYVNAEPAPYCMPPVNLFDRQIVLLPASPTQALTPPDVRVQAIDHPPGNSTVWFWIGWSGDAPISWADKPFAIGGGG